MGLPFWVVRLAVALVGFCGALSFFAIGVKVRGGSVLSARSVAVLAILSAYCLAFLVGFRLTSALTFSLSTIPLYYIAIVISICKIHKDIALSLCNFYIAIVIALCYNVVK